VFESIMRWMGAGKMIQPPQPQLPPTPWMGKGVWGEPKDAMMDPQAARGMTGFFQSVPPGTGPGVNPDVSTEDYSLREWRAKPPPEPGMLEALKHEDEFNRAFPMKQAPTMPDVREILKPKEQHTSTPGTMGLGTASIAGGPIVPFMQSIAKLSQRAGPMAERAARWLKPGTSQPTPAEVLPKGRTLDGNTEPVSEWVEFQMRRHPPAKPGEMPNPPMQDDATDENVPFAGEEDYDAFEHRRKLVAGMVKMAQQPQEVTPEFHNELMWKRDLQERTGITLGKWHPDDETGGQLVRETFNAPQTPWQGSIRTNPENSSSEITFMIQTLSPDQEMNVATPFSIPSPNRSTSLKMLDLVSKSGPTPDLDMLIELKRLMTEAQPDWSLF
jgi:hypothetical protein